MIKIIRIPWILLRDTFKFVIIYMPGSFGFYLRYLYYRRIFNSCGKNVRIGEGVQIDGADKISVGNNVHIDRYCIISSGEEIRGRIKKVGIEQDDVNVGQLIIGDNVHITQFCIIMAYGGIKISDFCTLSANTKIYSLSNLSNDFEEKEKIISIMPYEQAPFLLSPVVLEENVWLGLNTIVMPGCRIGKNSFAVSNSVIVKSMPENSHISGNPAKRIRKRF